MKGRQGEGGKEVQSGEKLRVTEKGKKSYRGGMELQKMEGRLHRVERETRGEEVKHRERVEGR